MERSHCLINHHSSTCLAKASPQQGFLGASSKASTALTLQANSGKNPRFTRETPGKNVGQASFTDGFSGVMAVNVVTSLTCMTGIRAHNCRLPTLIEKAYVSQ